jgi:hypothetical protein
MTLPATSAALRGQVSAVLDELVEKDRLLMRVSAGGLEEYRLQTKESADWFAYQRGEEDALRSDPSAYESKIREQLMQLAGDQSTQAGHSAGHQPRNSPPQGCIPTTVTAPKPKATCPGLAALRPRRHPGQRSTGRRLARRAQLRHRLRARRAAAQG